MNQLFQISADAWLALDRDEVFATVDAMKEVGICRLPFPRVDIRLPLDVAAFTHADKKADGARADYIDRMTQRGLLLPNPTPERPDRFKFNLGRDAWLDIKNLSLESVDDYTVQIVIGRGNPSFGRCAMPTRDKCHNSELERDAYAYALIVLLNTRNAVKVTTHRKSVGLGIGKPGAYEYTTTISLPKIMEDDAEHPGEGAAKKPHLRRGHRRHQRFGPGFQFAKLVWIEPVFVNADPAWVDKRKAYNLSV